MDKPKFDPNKPFQAVKPKFDPNKPFNVPEEKKPGATSSSGGTMSTLQSLGSGALDMVKAAPGAINAGVNAAADSATFGYAPQISGLMGAAPTAVRETAEHLANLEAPTYDDTLAQYQASKDQALKAQNLSAENHPISAMGGTLAGAIMSPVPTPFKALKGETLAAKAGAAALRGGATGFIMNPGDKVGESDPLQLDDRLKNAAFGAPLGVAGESVAKVVEKSPEALSKMRQYFTAKELGANAGQMKQLLRDLPGGETMRVERVEKFLEENKLLNAGHTASDIEHATKGIRKETGEAIGETYKKVQSEIETLAEKDPEAAGRLILDAHHGPDLANEFLKSEQARLEKLHGGDHAFEQLKRELVGSEEKQVGLSKLGKEVSIPDLVNYRASVDDMVDWAKKSSERAPLQQSYVNLRNFLNSKINGRIEQLDKTLGSGTTKSLKALNERYADATLANKITESTKAREWSKTTMGLIGMTGGLGVGAYSLSHGDNVPEALAKGAALGLGSRAARIYGPGMAYSAAKAAQPLAAKASELFQRTQPGSRLLTAPWVEMTKDKK